MSEDTQKLHKNIVSTLNHGLKILDLLSVRPGLGVSEIARIMGYDKSSVYKMLYTLEHRSYVDKAAGARYYASKKLAVGSRPSGSDRNITETAIPYMRQLRDACGETVYLGILNANGRVIFLHTEDGLSTDAIITRVGYEMDAHTNATGKVLLANLTPAVQAGIIDMLHLHAHTPQTICSKAVLLEELDTIKGASCTEQHDENYLGHSDIAAPVYNELGRCIAALSIVAHTEKISQCSAQFQSMLIDTAHTISWLMGDMTH